MGSWQDPDRNNDSVGARPCIITIAVTGSMPRKRDNPAVPVTVSEQIESTHAAFEAGATVAHLHVRNDDETPSSDPAKFAKLLEGLPRHCPGLIVQFSTGGRSGKGSERGTMLSLEPDMASLATGSCNFPNMIYENPPALIRELAALMRKHCVKPEIEVFDLSLRRPTRQAPTCPVRVGGEERDAGRQGGAYLSGFGAPPSNADGHMDCGWHCGRHQLEVNRWALQLGGHCRTGLEDNVRWDRDMLAPSNAALVTRVAELCATVRRRLATVSEARALLALPPA